MLGQASENHWKITVVKKQKKINSGYPKSDGVHLESVRKSSGSVKTLPWMTAIQVATLMYS